MIYAVGHDDQGNVGVAPPGRILQGLERNGADEVAAVLAPMRCPDDGELLGGDMAD